jgi:DNA modification methylase
VQKWGVGALNIDATRIPYAGPDDKPVPHGGKARQHKDTPGWMSTTGHKVIDNPEINSIGRFPSNVLGEIPEYQKYFYCPKVSRKERHMGFDTTNIPTNPSGMLDKGNNHPTVKPVELMKYLIKLITPAGGTVLDPFAGSGSTGCAAVELGHPYIGCELDEKYVAIAKTRIEAWYKHTHANTYAELFESC